MLLWLTIFSLQIMWNAYFVFLLLFNQSICDCTSCCNISIIDLIKRERFTSCWMYTELHLLMIVYMRKYLWRWSFLSSTISGRAWFLAGITTDTSFESYPCLQSLQKSQNNITLICISKFWNSHLWNVVSHTNWWWWGILC